MSFKEKAFTNNKLLLSFLLEGIDLHLLISYQIVDNGNSIDKVQ